MVQVPRRKGRNQSLHKVSWKPGPRATGNTHSIAAVFKFLLAQFPIQDGDRSPHPRKMAGALKYYMPGTHLPKLRQEHCQALKPAPENFKVHENHRVGKIRGSWGALRDSALELKAGLTVRSDGCTVIIVSALHLTQDSQQEAESQLKDSGTYRQSLGHQTLLLECLSFLSSTVHPWN